MVLGRCIPGLFLGGWATLALSPTYWSYVLYVSLRIVENVPRRKPTGMTYVLYRQGDPGKAGVV